MQGPARSALCVNASQRCVCVYKVAHYYVAVRVRSLWYRGCLSKLDLLCSSDRLPKPNGRSS